MKNDWKETFCGNWCADRRTKKCKENKCEAISFLCSLISEERKEAIRKYDKKIRGKDACFFADCNFVGKCGYGLKRKQVLASMGVEDK